MPVLGANAAFSLGVQALGRRIDPYQVFQFYIEIQGLLVGSFAECSGLQAETELETYREGGVNEYLHHFAGASKYPPLVFKHGLSPIDGLWGWHQEIVRQGRVTRRNGSIYLLNRQQSPLIWWNFKDAFPYKWTGPDLQASSGDVAFEAVELVHRGLSRPRRPNLVVGATGGVS